MIGGPSGGDSEPQYLQPERTHCLPLKYLQLCRHRLTLRPPHRINRLHAIHREMGFRLLLNEHERIEAEDGELVLAGIENWGRGFRQTGKG